MGRQRKKVAFVGDTGTGKSTVIIPMIKQRCEKYKENAIVLDPNRQMSWRIFGAITIELLKSLKHKLGVIYRINTEEYETFFKVIFDFFKHGIVIVEDASNWAKPHENKLITRVLTALRHPDHDVDVIFVFHQIYRIPMYIFESLHEIVLFKTGDRWDDIKDMFPENVREMAREAFYRVQNHESKHYCERIVIKKTSDKELEAA